MGTIVRRDTGLHRCPSCNVLISSSAKVCRDCLDSGMLSQDSGEPGPLDGPRHPLMRFIWGLGISVDLWIIFCLAIVWFSILSITGTIADAFFWVLVGFGAPLILILVSGGATAISFLRHPLEEVDPIAIKVFAWVYMTGVQGWLIFQVVGL